MDTQNSYKRFAIRKTQIQPLMADWLLENMAQIRATLHTSSLSLNDRGEFDILLASILKKKWTETEKRQWLLAAVDFTAWTHDRHEIAYLTVSNKTTIKLHMFDWIVTDLQDYNAWDDELSYSTFAQEDIIDMQDLTEMMKNIVRNNPLVQHIKLQKRFVLSEKTTIKISTTLQYVEGAYEAIDDGAIEIAFRIGGRVQYYRHVRSDNRLYLDLSIEGLKDFQEAWTHFLRFITFSGDETMRLCIADNRLIYKETNEIDRTIVMQKGPLRRYYLLLDAEPPEDIKAEMNRVKGCLFHKDTSALSYIGPWSRQIASLYSNTACDHERSTKYIKLNRELRPLMPHLTVAEKYWMIMDLTGFQVQQTPELASSSTSSSSSSSSTPPRPESIMLRVTGVISHNGEVTSWENGIAFPQLNLKMNRAYKIHFHMIGKRHEDTRRIAIWMEKSGARKPISSSADARGESSNSATFFIEPKSTIAAWNPVNKYYYGSYQGGVYAIWGKIKLWPETSSIATIEDTNYKPPIKIAYELESAARMEEARKSRRLLFVLMPAPTRRPLLATEMQTGAEDLQDDTEVTDKDIVLTRTNAQLPETIKWSIGMMAHATPENWSKDAIVTQEAELMPGLFYNCGFTIHNPYASSDLYEHRTDDTIEITDSVNRLIAAIPFKKTFNQIDWTTIITIDCTADHPLNCKWRNTGVTFCKLYPSLIKIKDI